MSEWISVNVSLPFPWETVLVQMATRQTPWDERYEPSGFCVAYLYRYGTGDIRFKADINDKPLDVTHWMPLPESPK